MNVFEIIALIGLLALAWVWPRKSGLKRTTARTWHRPVLSSSAFCGGREPSSGELTLSGLRIASKFQACSGTPRLIPPVIDL